MALSRVPNADDAKRFLYYLIEVDGDTPIVPAGNSGALTLKQLRVNAVKQFFLPISKNSWDANAYNDLVRFVNSGDEMPLGILLTSRWITTLV